MGSDVVMWCHERGSTRVLSGARVSLSSLAGVEELGWPERVLVEAARLPAQPRPRVGVMDVQPLGRGGLLRHQPQRLVRVLARLDEQLWRAAAPWAARSV